MMDKQKYNHDLYIANRAKRLEYQAAYDAAHQEEKKAYDAEYHASHREEKRIYRAAYASEHRFAKRLQDAAARDVNRDRAKATSAAWYMANPEKRRDHDHLRRARRAGNANNVTITREHLKMLLESQDGRCRYCRTPLGPLRSDRHLDHRTPISRGGEHAPANVCWSCPPCNRRKYNKTEEEFLSCIG